MLAALLTLIAAQFDPGAPLTGQFDGTCLYPETLRERAEGDNLVTCNRVTVDDKGIVFASRSWGVRMRFSGTFEGDRMTVTSIAGRNGEQVEARGTCQIYYANEEVSTIACTAIAHGRAHLANFVVSRL
ncbi:hypothetical protein GCM10009127_02550 [Alteraurantiacibacter aestuarii]|uniref:DUF3617 family protein n=1 Tax=Alteraurantiacibacter aestuarii TaxID=650004 RepID=A0A844ZJ42_9SPHN|nr:hypothetical protein [Alteraurantiacibacter aestuarii]MXO88491.1 hypothetical protein [Alteraurantiacibacter aestuarii]